MSCSVMSFRVWGGLLIACVMVAALSDCGGKRATKTGDDEGPADQWSHGVWVYGQMCASCHGEEGHGDESNPPLAGDGSLPPKPVTADSDREVVLNTAHDVFLYTSQSMPPVEPGGLAEKDYWALVSYILFLRDGERRLKPLGAAEAKQIKLH